MTDDGRISSRQEGDTTSFSSIEEARKIFGQEETFKSSQGHRVSLREHNDNIIKFFSIDDIYMSRSIFAVPISMFWDSCEFHRFHGTITWKEKTFFDVPIDFGEMEIIDEEGNVICSQNSNDYILEIINGKIQFFPRKYIELAKYEKEK